ncbi:MAG TPA: DUF6585 family protein [Ktedonobacteraceae bacterium]|nr:DUF6585 family protein [Ktedonobacteraceae bacterium]
MSQSMQVIQDQSPSVKAEQLAATYHLGTPQQEYGVHLTRKTLFVGIISLVAAGGFGFLAYEMLTSPRNSNDINNAYLVIGIGVVFLLGALYCFLYPQIYRSWHVYVGSEGFAFSRGSELDAFRWDQIECMWQRVTRRYMNGIYTGTDHKYTVRGLDGRQVVLNDRITNVERLGNVISGMVTRVKLPEAIAAFKAGSTVTFGPLSVSMQGVSNSKELITWDQIKEFKVNNGMVIVKKEGKWLSWSSVQVANIPNFFVFLALVNAIMKQTN